MGSLGHPLYGKKTLTTVSKQVAESGEWKVVPKDNMANMVSAVLSNREAKTLRVSDKAIGREIDKVMTKVEAEVCDLSPC